MEFHRRYFPVARLVLQRGVGQLLVFFSTLYAARLVDPSTYGALGLFTSSCSFFAMASSLRFETRSLVARGGRAKEKLIGLSYLANLAFLLLGSILASVGFMAGYAGAWVLLVPIGAVLTSLMLYVVPAQRSSQSELSSLGVMTQSSACGTAILQLLVAWVVPSALPLMASRLVAWSLGLATVFRSIRSGLLSASHVKLREARRLYRTSAHEIFFGGAASLISVAELQAAVFVFGYFSLKHEVGLYWFAFNLLFVPYLVVSGAIRPLFTATISRRRSESGLRAVLARYTLLSAAAGFAFVAFVVPLVFVVVEYFLDSKWQGADIFSMYIGVTLITTIAKTPISMAASALGMQRFNLFSGAIQLMIRGATLALPLSLGVSPYVSVLFMSAAVAASHLIHIWSSLAVIGRRG